MGSSLLEWYEKTANDYGKKRGKKFFIDPEPEIRGFHKLEDVKKGEHVLDVGAGTGRYLIPLARRGALCHGIDFSPSMLNELSRKITGKSFKKNIISLKKADARKLPFDKQQFDWVICMGVLEYYPLRARLKILQEIKRVLVPDGSAIIDMPEKGNALAIKFQEAERSIGNKVYLYPMTRLCELLKKAGFRIKKSQKAGMEYQFLIEPVVKNKGK